MVSVRRFLDDADTIWEEIQRRDRESEKAGHSEYKAARIIQRWVRGFLERRHLAHLNEAATLIQKTWRAHIARRINLEMLRRANEERLKKFYYNMAATIQKTWRGYKVRRYQLNYRMFKEWLNKMGQRHKEVRFDQNHFEKSRLKSDEAESEAKAKENVLYILFKLHHMLRTKSTPGIYSILDSHQLSILEQQLKELKLIEYVDHLHKYREGLHNRSEGMKSAQLPSFVRHHKCEEYWHKRTRTATPPIYAQQPYKGCRGYQDPRQCPLEEFFKSSNRQAWLHWYSPCPCTAFRSSIPKFLYKEMPKAPMTFPPITHQHVPCLDHKSRHVKLPCILRERNASLDVSRHEFLSFYKGKDTSESYRKCKYGPFKPDISKTDLFLQRYYETGGGMLRKN